MVKSTKIISIITFLWALLGLSLGRAQEEKPLVISSISILDDMVDVLAGPLVEHRSIVPLGYDPHVYESTPDDAISTARADLIIMNGLTLEGWLGELIRNANSTAPRIIASDGIKPLGSEQYANSYDPHAWMTAKNGITYAQNIASGLIDLLPEHREEITQNLSNYERELKELDDHIMQQISTIPEPHRILVTSHDAFQYFGRRYGIALESILGVSTDADVRTKDVLEVAKLIKSRSLPAIFIESTINPKLMKQLAKENNTSLGGELFSDSLGERDGPAGTYLKLLKHNTDIIVTALTAPSGRKTDENENSYLSVFGLALIAAVLLGLLFVLMRRKI